MGKYKRICFDCGTEVKNEQLYLCPKCSVTVIPAKAGIQNSQILDSRLRGNDSIKGLLKIEYDYKKTRKEFSPKALSKNYDVSQARYISILPLKNANSLPPLKVGPTPLDSAVRVREKYGLKRLFLKNDTCLPTGSFKDRASSIVVAKALELGKKVVATASTGNAATALAGMAASVGMKTVIFVPEAAPRAKLTQIAMFGAKLIPVKGTYDDAFALCLEACEKFGWYNRNTGFNPYTIEGKKTAAIEIWEQLGRKAPDKIFIPTGDGVILSGIYKGFFDLLQMGLIKKIPQMIPVQAEGSAAIINALESGAEDITPLEISKTIADSISVKKPSCGALALKIVRETNGFGVRVSDAEILHAMKEMAELAGIFAEPAASAGYAGFIKARKRISKNETIVLLITGTGLKDIDAAMKAVTIPEAIEPRIESVKNRP